MSFLIAVLKWILGVEDDEDRARATRYERQRPFGDSTVRPHGSSQYAHHVPVATSSSQSYSDSYSCQTNPRNVPNNVVTDNTWASVKLSRDEAAESGYRDVFGTYAPKKPSISDSDKDHIAKESAGMKPYENKIGSSSRLPVSGIPPSTATASRPSFSVFPSEKVKSTSSALQGTNNDGRYCDNFTPAASKQFQWSSIGETVKSDSPELIDKPKPPPLSTKPTISLASLSSSSPGGKNTYIRKEKDASSTYVFPEEIKSLIEKDVVPGVLKMPLSKSSYKDYFHALLYAEDCYLEKWDGFEMEDMTVELHEAAIYKRKGRNIDYDDKEEKVFVAFELDKRREMRPFLISRDFVTLQPVSSKGKTFQGVIYRVVKSNLVLAEFEGDFYIFHRPSNKYDVKFSFNRVCLKRAHHAISSATEPLFRNLIFPSASCYAEISPAYKSQKEALAVRQVSRLQGPLPYLVEGPLVNHDRFSKTGVVIVDAILEILRANPSKKILVCAPMNRTCDLLMQKLRKTIPESDMFRANAAFREVDGVPLDILPSCHYEDDTGCFSCPSLAKLKNYKVILTTFMSSYRLYGEGLPAGHFSHVFLVDASSATEPEAVVPLASFATDDTAVIMTGAPLNHSGWIRSKIARENGLRTSYFERLRDSSMYKGLDPRFIVQL